MQRFYFDHNATTPVSPEVLETMVSCLSQVYGNASSIHHFGQMAKQRLEMARRQTATLIGCHPREIVFLSGGTEADNLALFGIMRRAAGSSPPRITTAMEHPAVLGACAQLAREGAAVTHVPVGSDGLVDPDDIRRALRPETVLVSVMHANNELGTVQPIAEIATIARGAGVYLHADGVQALGKIPVDVEALGVDLYSMSGHKIYGPKGVGALYVRRRNPRVQIAAQIDGGGHERGMRSGTLNVPGIVGLGKACEIAYEEMDAEAAYLRGLRDRLRSKLESELDYVQVNGSWEHRLPGNLNMSFVYVEGESLLMGINDVAVSSGSACTSATLEPSYVLKALGLGDDVAHSSIRFGLGRFNTQAEVDYVAAKVIDIVKHLRQLSPLYEMVLEGIDLTKIQWAAH